MISSTSLWLRQDDFDWDKLVAYAQEPSRRAVAQRLGYLLELYGLGTPSLIEALQAMVGASYFTTPAPSQSQSAPLAALGRPGGLPLRSLAGR